MKKVKIKNKNRFALISIFISLIISACINSSDILANETSEDKSMSDNKIIINLQIKDKIFKAAFIDSPTTKAFIEQLPLTINMGDLNNNEKYYYLNKSLPTASRSVGNINIGDIMLYGNNCLVVFYKSFSTPYSYTKLGNINDVSGFREALGNASISVSFSVAE